MKNSKETNIILLLVGMIFIIVAKFFIEYINYYLFLCAIIIIPIIILNMIKQRKEDKLNNTTIFKASVYRALIMGIVLLVFYILTKQNQI